MTVGVMVGGHGREWAACVAPAAAHSESCAGAAGVTDPAVTPVVHVTAGEDLPRALSTRACPARDLCLSLTQEKFRQRRRAHEPALCLQVGLPKGRRARRGSSSGSLEPLGLIWLYLLFRDSVVSHFVSFCSRNLSFDLKNR